MPSLLDKLAKAQNRNGKRATEALQAANREKDAANSTQRLLDAVTRQTAYLHGETINGIDLTPEEMAMIGGLHYRRQQKPFSKLDRHIEWRLVKPFIDAYLATQEPAPVRPAVPPLPSPDEPEDGWSDSDEEAA